jgi:hypothetical protein
MIKSEIKSFFDRHIVFEESAHKYTFDEIPCISVTGITTAIKKPFDSIPIVTKKAIKNLGKSATDKMIETEVARLLAEWAAKGNGSSIRGTGIHRYLECHFAGVPYDYDYELTRGDLNGCSRIIKVLNDLHIVPYALELIIGSKDLRLCGTIDFLGKYVAPSPKAGQFILIDWKTTVGKDLVNPGRWDKPLNKPLWYLKDGHNTMYSLQLNLYDELMKYEIDWWKPGCDKMICHIDNDAKFIKVKQQPYAEILLETRMEKLCQP